MKKIAILVIFLTLIAKFFGFARDLTLSYFYGTSYISDAYIISLTICVSIFGIIGKSVKSSFIPLYKEIEIKSNLKNENIFLNSVLNIMLVFVLLLSVVCIIFMEEVVFIFASGFKGEVLDMTILFTRIAIIGMSLTVLMNILSGFFQIKGNHTLPALISLPLNILIVIMIVLSSKYSLIFLPVGLLLGGTVQFLILFFYSKKYSFHYKPYINFKNKSIRKLFRNALSVFIGTSSHQINLIVDRTLASQIIEGGISALSYANRLNSFVQSIFVLSISTVMYPLLSQAAVENNRKQFNHTLEYALSAIAIMIIPVSVFTMIFSEEIITLLFGRGDFDDRSIYLTAGPLFYYSLGMLALAYKEVLNQAFYAYNNTRTPMYNSLLGVSINIPLNFILSSIMGINGLALATSISAVITTILFIISYKKKNKNFSFKNNIIIILKTLVASILMGIIVYYSHVIFIDLFTSWFSFILILIIGIITYIGCLVLLKVRELNSLFNIFLSKFK
ncbi:putative peptidoglycan biosynthesis protein MurJ [Jeotgalicoccus saudimassiliensis]|uniref:Probable lipid II flippase MurJ n=1 Tax=Jeotgalicoccus saudimassiliensis TaxID=1461582 RepID=A0A078M531_9STAP|nr:murein biosynthesis integral membrane protein MurJ [Jeotgalicoccus saudimassiliensis]CEA00457.1 putative peptidoglycan biosynthesis protein MurJ [Jeotgalicoccus saudimassiliensis]